MGLEVWTAIADIVAGFGIIFSLLLVGWQIRQNTRATRMDMTVSMTERSDAIRAQALADPDLAEILARADEDFSSLTHTERLKFSIQMTSYFNLADMMVEVEAAGYTSAPSKDREDKYLKGLLASPARKAWWERHAHEFSPELQARISEMTLTET